MEPKRVRTEGFYREFGHVTYVHWLRRPRVHLWSRECRHGAALKLQDRRDSKDNIDAKLLRLAD